MMIELKYDKSAEGAIKQIKEIFQMNLSAALRLRRVTAPLFVLQGTGLNDDLNGYEHAVSFPIQDMNGAVAEVVHSLAKWKRVTLADYNIAHGHGIYTDMNAIRAHEELDNLHSLYVDQWDWERVICPEERTVAFLKQIVEDIYSALLHTEFTICEYYPQIKPALPEKLFFIDPKFTKVMSKGGIAFKNLPDEYTVGTYKVNTAVLNVRKGAGTNFAGATTLIKGQKIKVVEVDGIWGRYAKNKWVSLEHCKKVG